MYQIGHKSSIDKGVSHLVDYRNESLHIYLIFRIALPLKYSSSNTVKELVLFILSIRPGISTTLHLLLKI
jgi:hypothetical protein